MLLQSVFKTPRPEEMLLIAFASEALQTCLKRFESE